MSQQKAPRRSRRWAEGIDGVPGTMKIQAHTTEDGRGKAVVSSIVDALSGLAGKWMDYEDRKAHISKSG